ncbi:MAG: hypothetical protein OEU36_04055 [Gammaproteobacteria bacterium]|nr:hypothetical protein [Gammaproteobacteria bacterium]
MIRHQLTAIAVLAMLGAPAFASQCPVDMGLIDEALVTAEATLSAEDLAKVMELRAQGEELHNSGDHDASVATLAEAKAILGIE